MVMHWRMIRLAAATLLAIGLTSCGSDSTGPSNVTLNDQSAREAGGVLADQAANLVSSFTYTGSGDLPLAVASAVLDKSAGFQRFAFDRPWSPRWLATDSCATFSDTTDTDADGIPDNLVVTFDGPGCTAAVEESVTASLTGSFRITDRGTNPGFDIAYSSVRLRFDHLNGNYVDVRLNGTQGVEATSTSATLNENLSTTFGLRENGVTHNGLVSQNWTAGFTAAQGQTFDPAAELPSGSIEFTGSTTWVADAQSAAFAMSTPVALAHVASCTQQPPFDSGTLRALVSGNAGGAFVRVQFIGCGQEPVITLVGQPAQ